MDGAAEAPISRPGRRFGLVDGLIVLGAIAVASSILWDMPGLYQHLLIAMFSGGNWAGDAFFRNWLQFIQGLSALLAMPLCFASATIVALNLRSPRPPLEHLARQPGFMASATVMMLLVPGSLLAVKYLVIARLVYFGSNAAVLQPRFLMPYLLAMMPIPAALGCVDELQAFGIKHAGHFSDD